MTIPGLLLEQARVRPDAIALRSKRRGIWHTLTCAQLLERTGRMAAGLRATGVTSGGAVGVVGENSPEWIVADLAAQALGARSVALPPQTPAPAIARALAAAGATVVVCGDQEQVDAVCDAGGELACVRTIVVVNATGTAHYDDPRLRTLAELEEAGAVDAADVLASAGSDAAPAATLFSAGSGGDPRPAEHSGGSLAELARLAAGWLELGPGDRSLCVLPLATPAARVIDVYAPLAAGAEITVPESPATVAADLREAAPTVVCLSPRALELLRLASERRARESARLRRKLYGWAISRLDARLDSTDAARTPAGAGKGGGLAHALVGRWVSAKLGLDRARRIVVTGGAPAQRDLRFFWSLGVPVLGTYGDVEVAGLALAQASLDDAGLAGRPLPGTDARVLDDGTLAVATPATAGDWHATGDLGEEANGAFRVLGRREEVVRAEGAEVVASAVEAALCESPFIRRAVVATGGGGTLGALLEIDPDTTALWAAENGLAFSTYGALVGLAEVHELAAAEVETANERLPAPPRIAGFAVLPRQLEAARGELTPLLTVRRSRVLEHFATQLGSAAGGRGSEPVASAS